MTDEQYAITCAPATADLRGARITTVRLSGEFDLNASEALQAAVHGAVAGGQKTAVSIDLTGVTFIDAMTVGVLLNGYFAAHDHELDYQLTNARGSVQRLLDMLDATNLLQPGRQSA